MPPRNDAPLVTILANASCPHCVHATDTLTDWCCEAGIRVAGVDVAHHPDVAQRHQIEHSPALLFESGPQRRVYTGFPSHDEFRRFTGAR